LQIISFYDSDTQVKAIADEIDKSLRDEGTRLWHKEGYQALTWVLLDYVDVVAHIFKKEAREYYNIEKLWGDAPAFDIEDPLLKQPAPALKRKSGRPRKNKTE
jgi:ribosome-associated protein